MNINGTKIDEQSVYFIAEAGVNHNGSITKAEKLIEAAADAGADAIKFQTFKAKHSVSENQKKVKYQKAHTSADESQYEMLSRLELSERDHRKLATKCDEEDITFLSTPSAHPENVDLLSRIGVPAIKIGSSDLLNIPLLRRCLKEDVPLIISTGMSTMDEVTEVNKMIGNHDQGVAFLHCISEYPTKLKDVNLNVLPSMQRQLNTTVGFSDHTISVHVPSFAVGAGAQIIEKHVTLDRDLSGPDHQASLEPNELSTAVDLARQAARARGNGIKKPTSGEKSNLDAVRRSIHAAEPIPEGEKITEEMIKVKRPNSGISPIDYDKVVGTMTTTSISAGSPITLDSLKL